VAKATCMSESGTPDPGRDIPEEEAPLITEIRRVYEIQKQLLHERAEKELALLERREKKWYWRAWWCQGSPQNQPVRVRVLIQNQPRRVGPLGS
jgi:hypothetical protein